MFLITIVCARYAMYTILMEKPVQHMSRYRRFSTYLKERYGGRVRKISLDAGFSCPNRDGTLSSDGCVFCEPAAFNPHAGARVPLAEQIAPVIARNRERAPGGFIAYFQTFTNTYGTVSELRAAYDVIRGFPEIKVLAVGTRPDCIDREKMDLLAGYLDDYDVWIEYGLQSIHDVTLHAVNRGHGADAFHRAAALTREYPGIRMGAHLILGLPGETPAMERETARAAAGYGIDAVKLHPLHVIRGTALEREYAAGRYVPLKQHEYVTRAVDVLRYLPPDTVIERLTADCPADRLLAPEWLADKHGTVALIEARLKELDTRQGACYTVHPEPG